MPGYEADQEEPARPAPEQIQEPGQEENAGGPSRPRRPRKWLTAVFNMASGAVVSLAVKTSVVACCAPFLSPVIGIGIAAAAAGVASSYARHYLENRNLKKLGQEPVRFTFKKAAFGAGFGLAGAGLAAGASEAIHHFAGTQLGQTVFEKLAEFKRSVFGLVAPGLLAPELSPPDQASLPTGSSVESSGISGGTPDAIALPDPAPESPVAGLPEPHVVRTITIRPGTDLTTGPAAAVAEPQATGGDVSVPARIVETIETPAPESLPAETPAAEIPPAEIPAADALAPVLSAAEQAHALAGDHAVSAAVRDAVARSGSGNARVAAQGLKDLGYFLYNGFGGMPENQALAVQLFQDAAAQGNIQAKIDLAYILYHGNDAAGIAADPDAALAQMREIGSPRARDFVREWSGGGNAAHETAPRPLATEHHRAAARPVMETPRIEARAAPVSSATPVTPATPAAAPVVTDGCQAVVRDGGNTIDLVCSGQDQMQFRVGEKVTVQHPAILQLMR